MFFVPAGSGESGAGNATGFARAEERTVARHVSQDQGRERDVMAKSDKSNVA
jgi:hypothetical protein